MYVPSGERLGKRSIQFSKNSSILCIKSQANSAFIGILFLIVRVKLFSYTEECIWKYCRIDVINRNKTPKDFETTDSELSKNDTMTRSHLFR